MHLTTLCFLLRPDEVLLALKKRGFGAGKWNGVGGKVGPGERISDAAIRETTEEIGVSIEEKNLEQRGVLHFSFDGKPEWDQECHVFVAERFKGDPRETEEMRPEWFPRDKIPFEKMWVDDPLWLPQVLSGASVEAFFTFDATGTVIKSHHVTLVGGWRVAPEPF